MTENNTSTFPERLKVILGPRRQYAWGSFIGATRGSINRMFKGDIPGWEILLAIHDIERVNLNWLLSGEDHPYNVIGQQAGDEELAAEFEVLLAHHADWRLYWINHRTRFSVIFIRNAMRHTRDKRVEFQEVKVLGPGGGRTLLRHLDTVKTNLTIRPLSFAGEAFHRLTTGQMSNLEIAQLIEGTNATGQAMPYTLPNGGNYIDFKVGDPRQIKVDSLSHNITRLNLKQRRLVRTLVTELLQQEGKRWEEVY